MHLHAIEHPHADTQTAVVLHCTIGEQVHSLLLDRLLSDFRIQALDELSELISHSYWASLS